VTVDGTADGTARVTVRNTGAVPLTNAVAWVTGKGLRHTSGADPVEVPVGDVAAGQAKAVEVPFTAAKSGRYPVTANVVADGGLTGRAEGSVAVARNAITLRVVGPDSLALNQDGLFEVRVTNAGDGDVTNVRVKADLPPGLSGEPSGSIPTLAAGETKSVKLTVRGDRLFEKGTVTATATAEVPGGRTLSADGTAPIGVFGTPALTLELADPAGPVPVGGRASYRVVVRNRGTAPAKNVDVEVELSAEFDRLRGLGPRQTDGVIAGRRVRFPAVDELPPGASATYLVDAEAATPGDGRATATVRAAGVARPLSEEQRTRVK
jgi:uncharacterized membrane protein